MSLFFSGIVNAVSRPPAVVFTGPFTILATATGNYWALLVLIPFVVLWGALSVTGGTDWWRHPIS